MAQLDTNIDELIYLFNWSDAKPFLRTCTFFHIVKLLCIYLFI